MRYSLYIVLSLIMLPGVAYAQCDNPKAGDCCTAHLGAGCSDSACCELIVALHPQCATFWNVTCRNLAIFYCKVCGGSFECGSSSPSLNPCCAANSTPYCYDATCCESVCAVDPTCCDATPGSGGVWGQHCADLAWKLCPDLPGCEPLGCGEPDAGDCCDTSGPGGGGNGSPFCNDATCCGAVCDQDAYCCEVEWDECCAMAATDLCANLPQCQPPPPEPGCVPGAGDCFTPHQTPGCNNPPCCEAVCKCDPFCCELQWDQFCIDGIDNDCLCGAGGCGALNKPECFVPQPPSDLTGDWSVGVADLLILLASWGECPQPDPDSRCPQPIPCPADFDKDGSVGVADLLFLLQNWG